MRLARLLLLPLLALVAVILPVAAGHRTWFLRDTFQAHLEMKWAVAQGEREGATPLIDSGRGGGQPLAGNPNAAAFYPTNLLYRLVAPDPLTDPDGRRWFLWAFNAHFWLHWLLAPCAMAAFSRLAGSSRSGAATAGVVYGASGYLQSQLSFHNLIPAVAWTPLLLAAVLGAARAPGARRWWWATLGGLVWALILLGGDPLLALLAALGAASVWLAAGATDLGAVRVAPAAAARPRRAGLRVRLVAKGLPALAVAGVAGTLLAAPQLGELRRIVDLSYRGHQGYGAITATATSFDPRQLLDWLLPFAYGQTSLLGPGRFWGYRVFTDWLPFYQSVAPGVLTVALVAAAGCGRRRLDRWAWWLLGAGVFCVLGRFNPLAAPLFAAFPGALRYPIKFFLLVAIASSLLAGRGLERWLAGERSARRRGTVALLIAAVLLLGLLGWLMLLPAEAEATLARLMAAQGPGEPLSAATPLPPPDWSRLERLRWLRTTLLSAVGLGWSAWLLGGLGSRRRLRPALAVPALLLVHTIGQLVLLAPARVTDALVPYTVPPPLLAALPPGARVVHQPDARATPNSLGRGQYPEEDGRWILRRAWYELYPAPGAFFGLRYELNPSPEGLDSFLARFAARFYESREPATAIHLLRSWGVTHLIHDEALPGELGAELLARLPSFGSEVFAYRLPAALGEVALVDGARWAESASEAAQVLADPQFDPGREVVLAGSPPVVLPVPAAAARPGVPAGGTDAAASLAVTSLAAERIEVEVTTPRPTHLVVQRAHLPLWRATIGGASTPILVANLYRMAVAVPAGRHRVVLAVERQPLAAASGLAAVGALLLVILVVVGWWSAARSVRGARGDGRGIHGRPGEARATGDVSSRPP